MKTKEENKEENKPIRKFVINIKEVLPNKKFAHSNTKYIDEQTAKTIYELLK